MAISFPLSHSGAKLRAEKESLSQSRQLSKGGTEHVCYKSAMGVTVYFSQPYKLRGPFPVPIISILSQRSHLVTVLVRSLIFSTVAGLLQKMWKLDISVISGTGRGGGKEQQGSWSASSATSPLSQEPIGPNLAFALEKIKRGGWLGDGTPTCPNHWRNLSYGSGLGILWG